MNANATWSVQSTSGAASNAKWDQNPSMNSKTNSGKSANLPLKSSMKGGGSKKGLDAFSLLGKRLGNHRKVGTSASVDSSIKKAIPTAMSTSALSHMTMKSSKTNQTTKLRPETLKSLGIPMPSRKTSTGLKSALKKESQPKGMSRALTLASIREVEVFLPGEKSIKRNTSINFNESVSIRNVTSSSSLVENKNELWFQDHEFKSIRRRCKSVAAMGDDQAVTEDMLVNVTGDSKRGLERYMPSTSQTKDSKYEIWDIVMDAQDDFYYHGRTYDEEKLAFACRTLSTDSLQEAQNRARQDEQAVKHIMKGEAF